MALINQPFLRNYDINYPSLQSAFDAGDYCYVARHANDLETKGCALIMMGNFIDGLNILDKIDTERALYYKAFGFWCEGEKKEALKILNFLEKKKFKKAYDFKKLINKRIKILAQRIPEIEPDNEEIEIKVISFHNGKKIKIEPYEDIKDIKLPSDWEPDLFFYFRPEYGILPIGLERLSCPLIAFTADYDVHIYQRFNQIKIFDILVVTSSVDHYELSKIFNKKVYTYLAAQGIWPYFQKHREYKKDIDIFISGLTFHPLFEYKVFLVDKILKLVNKYNIVIFDFSKKDILSPPRDFLPKQTYYEYLLRSKIILAPPARRHGLIPTRGLEGIYMGSVALYPKGSGLEFFFNEEEGVVYYDWEDIEIKIRKIIDNWEEYENFLKKGQEKIKDIFLYPHAFIKFLKFIAFKAYKLDIKHRETNLFNKICPLTTFIENGAKDYKEEIYFHKINREKIKKLLSKKINKAYILLNHLAWTYLGEFYSKKIYKKENEIGLLEKR